jgi:DNA modification methylase
MESLVMSRTLAEGPKVFAFDALACEALENFDLNVSTADYLQPSALRTTPSGQHYRGSRIGDMVAERGGSTPFNLLPVAAGASAAPDIPHPATTPYEVAAWWVKYLLPPQGVLLDPFCGSGTMLAAGLDFGASKVLGMEKEKKYLRIAEKRVLKG